MAGQDQHHDGSSRNHQRRDPDLGAIVLQGLDVVTTVAEIVAAADALRRARLWLSARAKRKAANAIEDAENLCRVIRDRLRRMVETLAFGDAASQLFKVGEPAWLSPADVAQLRREQRELSSEMSRLSRILESLEGLQGDQGPDPNALNMPNDVVGVIDEIIGGYGSRTATDSLNQIADAFDGLAATLRELRD